MINLFKDFGKRANEKFDKNPKANRIFLKVIVWSFELFSLGVGGFILYQYPRVKEVNEFTSRSEINGKVEKIIRSKGNVRISLDGQGSEFVFGASTNYLYAPPDLASFISEGDSVLKAAYSDSLIIRRDGIGYYFMLERHINKEPR